MDFSEATVRIELLTRENNERDQFFQLNSIKMTSVPFVKKEKLFSVLKAICSKLGFDLQLSDVDTIHRVRRFISTVKNNELPSPLAIIVCFTQRMRKHTLLAAALQSVYHRHWIQWSRDQCVFESPSYSIEQASCTTCEEFQEGT